MTARRFPPPWTVVENAESFWRRRADRGWFYFRHNEETARQAKVLTRDEARRMAVNFARLPELLGKTDPSWTQAALRHTHSSEQMHRILHFTSDERNRRTRQFICRGPLA
jgi:hypothetical protein